MAYKHKLSLIFILLTLLSWPVLTMAQAATEPGGTDFTGPLPAAESAAAEQRGAAQTTTATEQKGECQPGGEQKCPEKEQKRQNSAEQINVKLQVPLPFVPIGGTPEKPCRDKEGNQAVCKLTDYIAGMYRLLVGLGALFAVVMVIIGGYQWIFAGGSADKIGAAKKRIMGAFIGLILALLSYVILNSISARLVELRLPMVDPVPGIAWSGSGEFCQDSPTVKAYAATYGKNQTPALTPEQAMAKLQFNPATPSADGSIQPVALTETVCGQQYSIAGVDSVGTCKGKTCASSNTSCVLDRCLPVYLSGDIAWGIATGLDPQNFFSNAYVDFIEVYAICDNKTRWVQELNTDEKIRRFNMPRIDLGGIAPYQRLFNSDYAIYSNESAAKITYRYIAEKCPADKFKGFALRIEVNDDTGWLPTFDDTFAVGKNCSQPLGPLGAIRPAGSYPSSFANVAWSVVRKEELFSLEDFDAGATCNISVDRNLFPAQN